MKLLKPDLSFFDFGGFVSPQSNKNGDPIYGVDYKIVFYALKSSCGGQSINTNQNRIY